jgi:hypothetical protein
MRPRTMGMLPAECQETGQHFATRMYMDLHKIHPQLPLGLSGPAHSQDRARGGKCGQGEFALSVKQPVLPAVYLETSDTIV